MWQTNLIRLYYTVNDNHSTIEEVMQRQSNNHVPKFTDEECITVYLWGIHQRRFEQKAIYNYVRNHLLEWFPKLPSYQAFCRRLGELVPVFQALAEIWMEQSLALHDCEMAWIVDSCPIIDAVSTFISSRCQLLNAFLIGLMQRQTFRKPLRFVLLKSFFCTFLGGLLLRCFYFVSTIDSH